MKRTTVGTHQQSGVPARAGIIAHKVIGEVLADATPDAQVSVDRLDDMVRRETRTLGAALNAKRVRVLALTSAAKYLKRLCPTRAVFIGAEMPLGNNRVDLMWMLPDGTLFADEIKTERYLNEESAAAQAQRYLLAGQDALGDALEAVRVISTTQEGHSLLIGADLSVQPLRSSLFSIPTLRAAAVTTDWMAV